MTVASLFAAAFVGWAGLSPTSDFKARVDSYGRFGGELGELFKIDGKYFRGIAPTRDMLIEQSVEIPCAIGVRFGAFFLLELVSGPVGSAEFTLRWDHPEIRDPPFAVGTRDEFSRQLFVPNIGGALVMVGWALDSSPQLISGRWTGSIVHDGVVLASQDFLLLDCPELSPPDRQSQLDGLRALWGWFRATPAGPAGRF